MQLSQKKEIKKIIVESNSLIKDVINNLNNSGLKIVLVVKNNKLVGTIVDGDIRRGLLNGISIEDKITEIVHNNPIVATSEIEKNKIIILMKEMNYNISQLLIN